MKHIEKHHVVVVGESRVPRLNRALDDALSADDIEVVRMPSLSVDEAQLSVALVRSADLVIFFDPRSPHHFVLVGAVWALGIRVLFIRSRPDERSDMLPILVTNSPVFVYTPENFEARDLQRMVFGTLGRQRSASRAAALQENHNQVHPAPARVLEVHRNDALVRADDGREARLAVEDLSWIRGKGDLTKMLKNGQILSGFFETAASGATKYSLLWPEENPWPELIREFPLNEPFVGKVHSDISRVGVFVALGRGVNGLVPRSTIPTLGNLNRGQFVVVKPVRIDAAAREVELRLVSVTPSDSSDTPPSLPFELGEQFEGSVVHIAPGGDYVLVEKRPRPAVMLHSTDMDDWFRDRVVLGEVAEGERIRVQVIEIDEVLQRVHVIRIAEGEAWGRESNIDLREPTRPAEFREEHHLLVSWARLLPYVATARRLPRTQWPEEMHREFAAPQVHVIDEWWRQWATDLTFVARVRNRVAHGLPVDRSDVQKAMDIAEDAYAAVGVEIPT